MNKIDEKLFDKYSYGTSRDTSKQINRGAFENLLSERDTQRVCANCKYHERRRVINDKCSLHDFDVCQINIQSCIRWEDKDEQS